MTQEARGSQPSSSSIYWRFGSQFSRRFLRRDFTFSCSPVIVCLPGGALSIEGGSPEWLFILRAGGRLRVCYPPNPGCYSRDFVSPGVGVPGWKVFKLGVGGLGTLPTCAVAVPRSPGWYPGTVNESQASDTCRLRGESPWIPGMQVYKHSQIEGSSSHVLFKLLGGFSEVYFCHQGLHHSFIWIVTCSWMNEPVF